MSTPGVIVNPHAGRIRRDPGLAQRLCALLPEGYVQLTADAAAVEPALRSLRERGVDTLVVVGGDGTVAGTLTPLLRNWPGDALPSVVPSAGGTINTIARSLGARGTPEGTIRRVLAGGPPHSETRRAVVRVRADGGRPVFGLIFVNGVGVRWLEMYYTESARGVRGAVSVIGRIVASALVGGSLAQRVFAPFDADVVVDGKPQGGGRYTVMGAAGVQHIGLGFRPFRTAGEDPTRIHFTTTAASATRLARELPAQRLGLQSSRSSLRHASAQRIAIRFDPAQSWSLDAETFPPARTLEIAAGPTLRFVVP